MLAEVTSDSAVGGFSLNATIWGDQNGGHQTERAVSLSNNIGLNVTIVILASPNVATWGLNSVSDHIVDQSVLVPEFLSLELFLVGSLVKVLKDIFEAAIVFLKNSVLGTHVKRVVALKCELETSVSEASD